MRLLVSFALFAVVVYVSGCGFAGSLERLLFFTVYRLEIDVLHPAQRKMGFQLKGSLKDGTCKFEEFVQQISNIKDMPKILDNPNDLSPDIDRTAVKMDRAQIAVKDKIINSK